MDAETAPRIRFDEITGKDLVEIGRTANALYGTLERARRALDARTAELRQRELTIAKRELELAAREKEIEAREAGGEAAQAQIAQFRVALQMAQTWFSATDSAASGAAKKPGGLSASKIGAEAPLIAKPLFGNASGGAGRSNGNGATRLGHARADADAARSRVQSQFN